VLIRVTLYGRCWIFPTWDLKAIAVEATMFAVCLDRFQTAYLGSLIVPILMWHKHFTVCELEIFRAVFVRADITIILYHCDSLTSPTLEQVILYAIIALGSGHF
jgi:hypothetical protein